MSSVFIFNQYYIDLLKRIKTQCKEKKDDEEFSRILKVIKSEYSTLDKSSYEYIKFINIQFSDENWNNFVGNENWFAENGDIELYKSITLDQISKIFNDEYLHLHFLSVFFIFKTERDEEDNTKIVNLLQSSESEKIEGIVDENVRNIIKRLLDMRNKKLKSDTGFDMKFIEDTTLGKLAKEIIEDIDIGKMQKSIGEKGDVLKAIGDPDSGFAEIITSVSQKMASKISNGELKQENIIQDAMKLASSMPGMMGNGSKNTPDMSNIMQMMSTMMGNGNDMQNLFKQMSGSKKKGQRNVVNEGALKKMAAAKKMKNKLHKKQKEQVDNPM